MPIGASKLILFGQGELGGLPTHSIDFELSSSQLLEMTQVNFGTPNRLLFAVSIWYKRESIGTDMVLVDENGTAFININSNNQLDFQFGGSIRLQSTAQHTDTASWHHFYMEYDSAQGTAADRVNIYHDGTIVSAFDIATYPSASQAYAPGTGGEISVGGRSLGVDALFFDGLLYDFAYFSGSLPGIGAVYSGGSPVDVTSATGLYSRLTTESGDNVGHDEVIGTDWTNTNTATASATIPT